MKTNSSPDDLAALNDLPIRAANGAVVYMKDVAQVHMGFAVQTNIVRENGKRSALLQVLKNGDTSTLDIVSQTKAMVPQLDGGAGEFEGYAAVRPVDFCAVVD
jgi:multidrug efflux pump subunit AcrB